MKAALLLLLVGLHACSAVDISKDPDFPKFERFVRACHRRYGLWKPEKHTPPNGRLLWYPKLHNCSLEREVGEGWGVMTPCGSSPATHAWRGR